MAFYHLTLIALIQGLTEFLPVSSSGHLILLPGLTGIKDQGNVIDVAAHVGTLFAVMLYFRSDVAEVLAGLPRLLTGRLDTKGARLALFLVIATIPVIVLGLIIKVTGLADAMRNITVIGWTMLVFGLLLYWFDQRTDQSRDIKTLTLPDAIKLGLWQMIALIPGTSRSGIVITGALAMGFERKDAARVAMLMSIPTIIASGTLSSLDLIGGSVPVYDTTVVVALSFLAALVALSLMMRLLNTLSFSPYVIYRVILGIVLLVLAYSGWSGF